MAAISIRRWTKAKNGRSEDLAQSATKSRKRYNHSGMSFDPYSVFGVPRNSDFAVLRAAYRRLARENHPDVASDKVEATARMAQINRAWAILGDATKRAALDANLHWQLLESQRSEAEKSEEQRRETLRREAAKREIARAKAWREAAETPQKMKGSAAARPKNEAAARGASARGASARSAARKPETSARPKARDSRSRGQANPDLVNREIPPAETANRRENRKENRAVETQFGHRTRKERGVSNRPHTSPRALRLMRQIALASRLWHRDSDAGGAIEMCRAVLLADGRNVPARELLSDIFAAQNRIEVALMMLDQALQIAPDDRLLRRKRDHLQLIHSTSSPPLRAARPLPLWQRVRARLLKR